MKIIFEENDIQSGMYLIRNSKSKEIDYSFDSKRLDELLHFINIENIYATV